MSNSPDYDKLLEQLNIGIKWPSVYMFKFIIEADNHKIGLIESKFSENDQIEKKQSANGKYISISIKSEMQNAESVILKYKEMQGIEGLISL